MILELLLAALALSPNGQTSTATTATPSTSTASTSSPTTLALNTNPLSSDLSVTQLITSTLQTNQLKNDDHLLIKVTSILGKNSKQVLPRAARNSGQVEITAPFDSDNYKKENGTIQLANIMKDISAHTTKMASTHQTPSPLNCGNLTVNSQIELNLSNCTMGTLTHTYQCKTINNKSRWVSISTNQTPESFAHKCIAASK